MLSIHIRGHVTSKLVNVTEKFQPCSADVKPTAAFSFYVPTVRVNLCDHNLSINTLTCRGICTIFDWMGQLGTQLKVTACPIFWWSFLLSWS